MRETRQPRHCFPSTHGRKYSGNCVDLGVNSTIHDCTTACHLGNRGRHQRDRIGGLVRAFLYSVYSPIAVMELRCGGLLVPHVCAAVHGKNWNLGSVAGMDSGTARNLLQHDVSASRVPPTDNITTFAAVKLQYLSTASKEIIPTCCKAASKCAHHGCDKIADPASKRVKHVAT